MTENRVLDDRPWYTTTRFQRVALAIVLAVVVIEGVVAVFFRANDFVYHFDLGTSFLEDDPYQHTKAHYTVGRAMLDGLIALLPYRLARGMCYVAAIGALTLSLWLWNRMANVLVPKSGPLALAAAFCSLGLVYPYVIRDLDECGLQIALLLLLTLAGYAVFRGRWLWAGVWLAAGVTYKTTPLLFLPLLVWKRQWRALGATVVFLFVFNGLAPALWLGWEGALEANRQCARFAGRALQNHDPADFLIEMPKHQNQSLPLALTRYLRTWPAQHPLCLAHPWFVQFGTLSTEACHRVVRGVLFLIAGVLACRWRRPWRVSNSCGNLATEWAAATLFCALLSPLCWLQHLVLVLPCLFLAIRAGLPMADQPRWRAALIGLIGIIVLLLQRDVVQRELSILVLSYKLDTFACLLALLLSQTIPGNATRDRASVDLPGNSSVPPTSAAA